VRLWSAEMAAISGCPERRLSPRRWPQDAVVVLEQPRCDQPFSGRALRGHAESFTGAFIRRAGQRTVQDRGSGEVQRPVVVPQAPGDLAVVDEPRSWSERIAVVTEPGQDLARVRETRFQSLQRADGSVQRPSQTARQLLRGARLLDAGEHGLDGAVVRGPVPVKRVDRATPGIAGPVGVLPAQQALTEVVGQRAAWTAGSIPGPAAQRVISAAAPSS
jgi:hypothetical protein